MQKKCITYNDTCVLYKLYSAIYNIYWTEQVTMSGGDLSRVNELSSEIDLDKQIVLKQHSRHVTLSSQTF